MRRRSSHWLGPITKPIDEWLDRNPGGKVVVCEANRLKFKGNWKLAYDNSGDGYHVVYSHRSLLETENRLADEGNKGMAYYRSSPDTAPMYMQYMGNGHHFKDKRPNLNKRPGGLWAIESPHPGMEHCESAFKQRYGERALDAPRPRRLRAGEHQRVPQPVAARQPHPGVRAESRSRRPTRSGTARASSTHNGDIGDALDDINALRMRTQEGFPNFGEVDDVANFEQIQRGLQCIEDEWVYMHRGLGIPGRIRTLDDGTIMAPATDEAFMREYIKEWKRLMKARPNLAIQREP